MPLSIAEYLGQRTDSLVDIVPTLLGGSPVPTCPFSGAECRKLKSNPPLHPVCSVRVHDRAGRNRPFIVCPDRLLPTKQGSLSGTQMTALNDIARHLFPGVSAAQIGYRSQVGTSVNGTQVVADYILQVSPTSSFSNTVKKVVLEIQGGGETGSTGSISRHVTRWSQESNPTNTILSTVLDTQYLRSVTGVQRVNSPGIVTNNAWKRQLGQILVKAPLAMHFGGAFAIVTGDVLFDYFRKTVPIGGAYKDDWNIAFVSISESQSSYKRGEIPIDDVSNVVFMTYDEFMQALKDISISSNAINPFIGNFKTLNNSSFQI